MYKRDFLVAFLCVNTIVLQVTGYPNVLARAQNKNIILAAGPSLILLENEESDAECRILSFEAAIEHLSVSHSGNLIVCLLANGAVHGVFIKGIPVFNLYVCLWLCDCKNLYEKFMISVP